ncbi:MAG: TetR/AcrR family transcriptional regulator C-terminal domain-containing protein [Actinoplanes sp.]
MQLRRADVVTGALTLLDAGGLDGLTMRKLAAQLGVQAGALYWHFPSKQALLTAMADRMISDLATSLTARLCSGDWEAQANALAHGLRAALLAHRDGARVMAGTYVTEPNTTKVGGAALAMLTEVGFTPATAMWVAAALMNYVLGHTIEEQALAEHDPAELAAKRSQVSADPAMRVAFDELTAGNQDERFAFGLSLFLDGVRHRAVSGSGG